MKTRLVYPASLAALAAVVLLACGSSDDDDNTADSGAKTDSGTITVTPPKDSGTTTPPVDAGTDSGMTTTPGDSGTDSGMHTTDGGVDAGDASTAMPTFTNVYSTILGTATCTSCHNPQGSGFKEGKLDMSSQATAYTNLFGVAASGSGCGTSGETRVVADSAANSLLWQKVNHSAGVCGAGMPLEGTMLSAAQITLIADWINAGALNN